MTTKVKSLSLFDGARIEPVAPVEPLPQPKPQKLMKLREWTPEMELAGEYRAHAYDHGEDAWFRSWCKRMMATYGHLDLAPAAHRLWNEIAAMTPSYDRMLKCAKWELKAEEKSLTIGRTQGTLGP